MKKAILRWGLISLPPLVGVLVALGVNSAFAAKYKKATEVQVQAQQTEKTKVAPKPKEEQKQRPTLLAETFRLEASAKVEQLTDQAIATLKRLIQATDDNDPEKPDFFFRLAEHYRDKKTQFMFKARELDEKIYNSQNGGEKARLQNDQKSYEKAEQQWLIEAIKMYLHIAQTPQYQKFKRMDEVLFNVADMLNQSKRQDKARIFFRQLIRNYPQSKYIPDAYLSFAEFYFNDGKIDEALKLYEQVSKYPNSPIYGYAVYKQGWCWINLKDPKKALELFVKVIKESDQWGGSKKSKIVLVKEAKKDAVRAYAYVGTADKAWQFFQRIGGDYAIKMLEMLANLYYDQGKFGEAIQVYRKLIALEPKSKELCNWQYNIVRATLSGKDKREQVVESKRLAAVYQATKGRSEISKSSIDECRGNAASVLRELATTWHREAQKTQNNDTYSLAQYLYKEYLENFPQEKDAYTLTFYYAELLFKIEKWQDAAEMYTKVVKLDPKGKYLTESAYAAVISWKNALNVEEEVKDHDKGKGDISKPMEIPANQKKMIAAFDTYIKYVPNAPELVPIIYRKGRIFYVYNHHEDAIKTFGLIVDKHSDHELAIYAANLMLDSLNILKKYDELNTWVEKFLTNKNLTKDEEFLAQLRKLKAGAQWKAAESMQKNGKYRECGDKYAQIANEYQEDARWPKLLYNAAICYEAAKLIGQAIAVRNTLIKVKPKDPLAQKAMYMVGANYHALAWYSRAAEYYERYANEFPGENEASDALQNAIVFRLGRGEFDKAKEDTKLFEKNYGKRPKLQAKAAGVNFALGQIYEKKDDIVKHYQDYLKNWGKYGGQDRMILAHVKIAEVQWAQSCPVTSVNGACIKVERVEAKRKIEKKKGKKAKGAIETRTQCGPETKMKVTVVKRNPAKAKSAQDHFKQALKLFKGASKGVKGESKDEQERRQNDMNYAAAQALFMDAESEFEEFLQVKFPEGLDFSSKNKKKVEKSKKDFAKYLDVKGKQLEKTRGIYQDVIKMKVAHWAIAASARIGQLFQNFADALFTASIPKPPIPPGLTTKDAKEEFLMTFTDAYCDALEDKATPLETKAIEGLDTCLKKSTELSWYNEWSKLCETELNQIKPAEYPLAAELRAEPGYVSYKMDRAKVITEIQ